MSITDVADLAALAGADGILRAIEEARPMGPAPVAIAGSAERVGELVRGAVLDACEPLDGALPLVLVAVPPGVGKTYHAQRVLLDVAAGRLPIPAYGRRPEWWPPGAEWPPPTRRPVLALASHALADEKAAEMLRHEPSARVARAAGAMQHCIYQSKVADIYAAVGRRGLCGPPESESRCEHAATCPGAATPEPQWGEVTVAPHAMVPHLRADLVVYDESPGVLRVDAVASDELATLERGGTTPRVRRWRERTPDVAIAAQLVAAAAGTACAAYARAVASGEAQPYSRRIDGEALAAMLDAAGEDMEGVFIDAFREPDPPPVPDPYEVRQGKHRLMRLPSRPAYTAMRRLAAWYVARRGQAPLPLDGPDEDGEEPEPAPEPQPCIVLEGAGRWSLEVRSVRPLPRCPAVILDATAAHVADEYRAAYPGRRIIVRELVVGGALPAAAVHMATASAARSRLIRDGRLTGAGAQWASDAIAAAVQRVRSSRPLAEMGSAIEVGVLTHRPLVLAAESEGGELAPLAARMAAQRVTLKWGYYGRDERATNAFERVAGLIMLGDPVAHIGACEADARALGVDADVVAVGRLRSMVEQGIARARHIRRAADDRAVLVYVGREPPDIDGAAWRSEALPPMRSGPGDLSSADLAAIAEWQLRRDGVTGVIPLAMLRLEGSPWAGLETLDASAYRRGRAAKSAARMVGARPYDVAADLGSGRTGMVVWAVSRDAAERWADAVGGAVG